VNTANESISVSVSAMIHLIHFMRKNTHTKPDSENELFHSANNSRQAKRRQDTQERFTFAK
jgi:hypothetical protein